MKEVIHTLTLFEDLYNGDPWLDITLTATLKQINAEQAAKKITPDINSIWEITNHMISWRNNVLQRVKGTAIVTPEHNYFLPVKDASPSAWEATLHQLELSQKDWLIFLGSMKDDELEHIYTPNNNMHFKHIHGIIQHDAYHIGQIVLLAKHFTNG